MAMQVDPRLLQQWAQALKGQSAPDEEMMLQGQEPMLVEEPSLEQQSIENQMANNVPDQITQEDLGPEYATQMAQQPPVPGVSPVPAQGPNNMSNLERVERVFKDYDIEYAKQIEQLQRYMKDYSGMDQGMDLRPLAAWASGVTGNQQLYQAAQAAAPESRAQVTKNLIEQQQKLVDLSGNRKQAKAILDLYTQEKKDQYFAVEQARKAEQLRLQKEKQEKMLGSGRDLSIDAQKLDKRLGDLVPGITTKLQNLEALIPGGIEGKDQDIPGVGPGMFAVPDFMLGKDASNIQQNARGLAADLIKLQSGTAASDKEVDRKMKELGMSPGSKTSTFRAGVQRLKNQITNELRSKQAAFKPEVVNYYRSQGGVTDKMVESIGKKGKTSFEEWKRQKGIK